MDGKLRLPHAAGKGLTPGKEMVFFHPAIQQPCGCRLFWEAPEVKAHASIQRLRVREEAREGERASSQLRPYAVKTAGHLCACIPGSSDLCPHPPASILKTAMLTRGGRSFTQGTFCLIRMWPLNKAEVGRMDAFLLFKENTKNFQYPVFFRNE